MQDILSNNYNTIGESMVVIVLQPSLVLKSQPGKVGRNPCNGLDVQVRR
jgi:hypothetical protein